ncbi:hypothetical protein GCM10009768_08360 [Leucobacter iarius]|uniref:Uncharacterized protein n=1 Tax=Leucobacter iarius TaxID=333963 RepID=A0ABN2LCY7_9MICO
MSLAVFRTVRRAGLVLFPGLFGKAYDAADQRFGAAAPIPAGLAAPRNRVADPEQRIFVR